MENKPLEPHRLVLEERRQAQVRKPVPVLAEREQQPVRDKQELEQDRQKERPPHRSVGAQQVAKGLGKVDDVISKLKK